MVAGCFNCRRFLDKMIAQCSTGRAFIRGKMANPPEHQSVSVVQFRGTGKLC